MLTAHLQDLLRARPTNTDAVDLDALYAGVEKVYVAPLLTLFMESEANTAVRSMNRYSSPGPDGFGPAFYMAAWQTVSPAVM